MAVTTELVLIRHGETDWNREHRLQGQAKPGPPLNDMGFQQTQMLCHVLQKRYQHFDAVVSSDLQRTLQTAQILAAPYQLQVQQHSGLRERHIGLLQGLTNKEAPMIQPEAWAALQSGDHASRIPGGGESLDELKQRLAQTLLEIAAQHQGQRVLVISHGGALHATHRAARGYEAHGKVSNCSISVVLAELDAAQPDSCQDSQDQPDSCQDCCHNSQAQPDCSQGSGYKPGNAGSSSSGSGSDSGSGGSSDDDVMMHSSMPSSAAGSPGSADDLDAALFDLEAEEGVGMRAAGFGGSAREA
ncbi:hypothetical protein OEZ85_005153 [Tetradesmus obliquus]|uniref:Phosphoglycerate mutase n=1 Tax=Tetradesmus obliquus TaxID=3088 RepID=A0ABY8UMG1_TETOB|nr:hypothetical protein OEZ85_005153 [Tetradesmus obliquus]